MGENRQNLRQTVRRISGRGYPLTPRNPRYPQLGATWNRAMSDSGAGFALARSPTPDLKPACLRGGLAMTDLRCAVPVAQALLPFRSIGEIAAKVVLDTAAKMAK